MAKWAVVVVVLCLGLGQVALAAGGPETLPPYKKVEGVGGKLNSVGSDTLLNLMTLWAEGFKKVYPGVTVEIEGKGSGTAPPALIEGRSQLGPMSRAMKAEEVDKFEKKFGFKPTNIGVALDGIGIYVNKDNPIEKVTLAQLDAIYSKTRKLGHPEDITTWGQLGLRGEWANMPISLYGRNSASGTNAYVKKNALGKGDYKDTVMEMPGSATVVAAVGEDKSGIGYSGMGYKTSGVRFVPLAKDEDSKGYLPNGEAILAGKYPLGRMLWVYVVKKPGEPFPLLVKEFMKYVLCREGQQVVLDDGFLNLPKAIAEKEMAKLGN